MKTLEVVSMHGALLAMKETVNPNQPFPVKFAYAASINLKRTKDIFDAYRGQLEAEQPASVTAYEAGRKQLLEEVSKKDADGKPIIVNNQYVIDDRPAFEAELLKLRADYPTLDEDIKKYEVSIKELNETEVDVSLHMVDIEKCPEEVSLTFMDAIYPMIKED